MNKSKDLFALADMSDVLSIFAGERSVCVTTRGLKAAMRIARQEADLCREMVQIKIGHRGVSIYTISY